MQAEDAALGLRYPWNRPLIAPYLELVRVVVVHTGPSVAVGLGLHPAQLDVRGEHAWCTS